MHRLTVDDRRFGLCDGHIILAEAKIIENKNNQKSNSHVTGLLLTGSHS
jgi:hypothetical protein